MIENISQILLANAQRGPSLRFHNLNPNRESTLKSLLGNKVLPFAMLFSFSILGARSGSAQVIVVQAPAMACMNSNSCTVVFSNPVVSGDTVWLVTDFASVIPLSVLDSLQNSYTISANVVSSPDGTWKQVAAWSQTTSPGSLSVTVNLTGSSPFMEVYAFDIRGGALDSQTSATGPAGAISIPMTDASAGEVNVAAIVSGGTANPGTGFTVSSNLDHNLSEWAAFASPGAHNITATSNAVWAMNAASFKPLGGTSGGSAPVITTQPSNMTVAVSQMATFSVVAAGTAPLSYQWQKNAANINGATGSGYTTPATASTDNGSKFQVVVSNSAGSITSNAATLTVKPAVMAPTITTQPANQTVTVGQMATFSVVAAGTAPLSYQWQKNAANIAGATGSGYTTPATASTDNGSKFQVVVGNSAGSITSSAVTLTVNPATVAPTITTQPANQAVTVGQTATFAITISDSTCSVMWQRNGSNVISGTDLVIYATPPVTLTDNGAQFGAVVYNCKTAANAHSNTARLTVTTAAVAPTISIQPANQTATAGQTATFSVVANGTAPLSYQWLNNGAAISGATSSSYTTPATTSSDNGAVFRVTVSNSIGSVTSDSAALMIASAQLANATVTVTTTGHQIPSNFGGISFDFFDAQTFVPNPLYPQLMKNLTFPGQMLDLNVEGDDSPWPGTPTSAQIATLNSLYTTLEGSGVSLRFTLPAPMCPSTAATTYATPAVASYIANAGAGWRGVTLGNEPDGACQNSGSYAGGYPAFKTNWDTFRTAITSLTGGSGLKFAGPSFGGQQPWNDASDLNSFVNGEAANLTYVSQHWYAQNGCSGTPSLSAELAAAQAKPSDANYASYVANAHKTGVPFRISEMNDIDCSGRSGISNTFAAALWLPDALFNLANVGTDGVNLVSDLEGFYDLLELPSPSTCTLNVTSGCILRPNYYGFRMFQEATQNGAKLLPVSTTTSVNVSIWATIDGDGIVRVVVLNKDETNSGTVNITLAGYGSASIKTLSAPSVTATTGVTYGGQTFDGSTDGTIQGTLSTTTLTPTSGVYTFTIAATSAALLTVAP
jgi:hypothetical protein